MKTINLEDFIKITELSELPEGEMKLLPHERRPILLYREGDSIYAIDNRCPHMGFPLNKGSIREGVLTCHWHHAQFDIKSGCTFDLFADDIPSYETVIENNEVYVSKTPKNKIDAPHLFRRLLNGLEQNIGIAMAKSIMALRDLDVPVNEIVEAIAVFGLENRDDWADGLVLVTITANLQSYLSEKTAHLALFKAASLVAGNCQNQPSRRSGSALSIPSPVTN